VTTQGTQAHAITKSPSFQRGICGCGDEKDVAVVVAIVAVLLISLISLISAVAAVPIACPAIPIAWALWVTERGLVRLEMCRHTRALRVAWGACTLYPVPLRVAWGAHSAAAAVAAC